MLIFCDHLSGIMGGNYAKGVTDSVNTHLGTSGKIATSELNSLSQAALTGTISHNGFNAKDILIDNLGSAIGNSALETVSVIGQQQTVDGASQALETLMIEQAGIESLVNGAVEGFNREVETQAAWRDDNQVPWRDIAYEGIYTMLDLQPKSFIPPINNESWVEKNNQAWTDDDQANLLGLTGSAMYGPLLGQGALSLEVIKPPLLIKQPQDRLFNLKDAEKGLRAVYDQYGPEMSKIVEKMYRAETRHFQSGQYEQTGAPGMEGRNKPPYYGWPSSAKFFEKYPEYAPIGTTGMRDSKGLSGQGGNKQKKGITPYIIFPSVEAGMLHLAYRIKDIYHGDYARWHTTNATAQEAYRHLMGKINTPISDQLIKERKA